MVAKFHFSDEDGVANVTGEEHRNEPVEQGLTDPLGPLVAHLEQ